ncbi:MAG: helix-turn-helix domain-containing protein [Evtepia sp.]
MEEFITRSTEEYRELRKSANQALRTVEHLIETQRPCIFNEVYLTGEEVRSMFAISVRSLQNYRDDRMISYTSIGGKILYPQSALFDVLERNFRKALR